MAHFEKAHAFTAQWEGGLVDHPADPGGITNLGISLRWLQQLANEEAATLKPTAVASGSEQIAMMPGAVQLALPRILPGIAAGRADIDGDGDIDADDIRALTPAQAAALFHDRFWQPARLADLPQSTATIHYDCMVNTGPAQATRIAQRACNTLVGVYGVKLMVDGKFGPLTRDFLRVHATPALIAALIAERRRFYVSLVRQTPSFAPFEKGWLNRCNALQRFMGAGA